MGFCFVFISPIGGVCFHWKIGWRFLAEAKFEAENCSTAKRASAIFCYAFIAYWVKIPISSNVFGGGRLWCLRDLACTADELHVLITSLTAIDNCRSAVCVVSHFGAVIRTVGLMDCSSDCCCCCFTTSPPRQGEELEFSVDLPVAKHSCLHWNDHINVSRNRVA